MEQADYSKWPSEVDEIQLIYKSTAMTYQRPQIKAAEDAYEVFLQSWDKGRLDFVEDFKIMLLNSANYLLGIVEISRGCTNKTLVDLKLIFAAAIKANASYIILAHNHPSGNIYPSQADKQMTSRIGKAGKILDIGVLDHLIVSKDGFYSFQNIGSVYH